METSAERVINWGGGGGDDSSKKQKNAGWFLDYKFSLKRKTKICRTGIMQ